MKIIAIFFALCLVAALIPFRSTTKQPSNALASFPGWSAAPIPFPKELVPITPSAREARFAEDFPGQIKVFTDGTRTYVVRWILTATRKLHPAADCLRALGYSVKPAPIFISADRSRWGSVNAVRNTEKLRVRERIVDATEHAWTDVSAWFWSAALGRSHGPWWDITIFEPAEPLLIKDSL